MSEYLRALVSLRLPPSWLWGGVIGLFGVSQLLLWRFLNVAPAWMYGLGAAAVLAATMGVKPMMRPFEKSSRNDIFPTIGTFLSCFLFALVLFSLGGEGRLFYSNIDWQIRYALLHDLALNPWPFVYFRQGNTDLLRAPLGMFFLPSLAWKLGGSRFADIALLLQNALVLATGLTLASRLLDSFRSRLVTLAVLSVFSGLDILAVQLLRGESLDHLENWGISQFSSNMTLAFWVPHHALPGWLSAIGFLLWHRGQIPLALFLAPLPLFAIWSPLPLIGLIPFAAYAVFTTIARRQMRWPQLWLPAANSLLALPSLGYLGAAGDAVGFRAHVIAPALYCLFQMIETLPYLLPLHLAAKRAPALFAPICLATLCLAVAPLIQVGQSSDFAMRASIPALGVLSFLVAQQLIRWRSYISVSVALLMALAVGAATPVSELMRAVRYPPAPDVNCSFPSAWKESFDYLSMGTYLAPLSQMPPMFRPLRPTIVSGAAAGDCWVGEWYHPSGV